MATEYTPRLSVDLTQEQFSALQELIPYRMKKQVFHFLVDGLIKMLSKASPETKKSFFGMVLHHQIEASDIFTYLKD